jgi:hypothetical protein
LLTNISLILGVAGAHPAAAWFRSRPQCLLAYSVVRRTRLGRCEVAKTTRHALHGVSERETRAFRTPGFTTLTSGMNSSPPQRTQRAAEASGMRVVMKTGAPST